MTLKECADNVIRSLIEDMNIIRDNDTYTDEIHGLEFNDDGTVTAIITFDTYVSNDQITKIRESDIWMIKSIHTVTKTLQFI